MKNRGLRLKSIHDSLFEREKTYILLIVDFGLPRPTHNMLADRMRHVKHAFENPTIKKCEKKEPE